MTGIIFMLFTWSSFTEILYGNPKQKLKIRIGLEIKSRGEIGAIFFGEAFSSQHSMAMKCSTMNEQNEDTITSTQSTYSLCVQGDSEDAWITLTEHTYVNKEASSAKRHPVGMKRQFLMTPPTLLRQLEIKAIYLAEYFMPQVGLI